MSNHGLLEGRRSFEVQYCKRSFGASEREIRTPWPSTRAVQVLQSHIRCSIESPTHMPFERLPVITTDARGEFPVSIIPETTPVCEGHRILNGHLLEFACVRTLECGRSACLDASESRNCSATACCDCCGEAKSCGHTAYIAGGELCGT